MQYSWSQQSKKQHKMVSVEFFQTIFKSLKKYLRPAAFAMSALDLLTVLQFKLPKELFIVSLESLRHR